MMNDNQGTGDESSEMDRDLLEILVEPGTQAPLRHDRKRGLLISDRSGLAYPVRDGVPIMLPEEAIPLEKLNSAGANATADDDQ